MPFTMRERMYRLVRRLSLPLGVALVLGLIGPFGTFELLPVERRVPYWLAIISVNWLLTDAALRRVYAVAGDQVPVPGLLVPLTGACLAAVPATGVVAVANGLAGLGWPENVALLFGQVLLLLAAISLPVYAWEDMQERIQIGAGPSPISNDTPPTRPADVAEKPKAVHDGLSLFVSRLRGPLDGRLVCLEAQDHYLVVHHSNGSEMILCRMEDAARELNGLGRRVHRSWWVATDAVEGAERQGQRTFLRLRDGRRVPVGRSFRADLKGAGWL